MSVVFAVAVLTYLVVSIMPLFNGSRNIITSSDVALDISYIEDEKHISDQVFEMNESLSDVNFMPIVDLEMSGFYVNTSYDFSKVLDIKLRYWTEEAA